MFAIDRDRDDSAVQAWLPLVLGGLASAIVALAFCPVPRLRTVSGREALYVAAEYVLATVAAGASAAAVCGVVTGWRRRERRSCWRVLWSFSVASAWVAPVVAFYVRDSLWAVSMAVILAALGSGLICQFRRTVGGITPTWRATAFLPLPFAALLLQLAVVCVLASTVRPACLLIGSATFVISFRWQSASALEQLKPPSRWQSAIRFSIAVGLALVFVVGSLTPYLEPVSVNASSTKSGAPMEQSTARPAWTPTLLAGALAAGRPGAYRIVQTLFGETQTDAATESGLPEAKSRQTAIVAGESYPGMILRPEIMDHITLVPRLPRYRVFDGIPKERKRDPVSIPFDGAYWFYRTSDRTLPPDAIEAHGDPASTSFKTTDFTPISMEAHQNLGRLIDLSCCGAIQVVISNGDRRPGTVAIEMTLVNTILERHPRQSLGTAPVNSTLRWFPGDDRPSVQETLTFRVPAHPAILQFDEIALRFESMSPREQWSARIAINNFRFIPSGF